MNRRPRNRWRRYGRAAAVLLAAVVPAAAAELNLSTHLASRYQYESNVYRFSDQVAEVTGTDQLSDRSLRHTAGIDAGYAWGLQTVQVMAEARQFRFEEFKHLDHNEYTLAAALDSELSIARVRLNVGDERRIASFEDRRTTQLIMERDRTGRAAVLLPVTPQWNVVAGARGRFLQSPLPDAPALPRPPPGAPARVASPDFTVHEAGFSTGVQYGILNEEHPEDEGPLLVGVLLDYTTVSFSGVTPQPPPPMGVPPETFDGYSLLSLGATASYFLDGMSSLDGKLGLTRYTPSTSGADSSLEAVGEIGYIRRFSVVTELRGALFRRMVPFAANGDTTTDTGASLGARWEPRRNLRVLGEYTFASSAFGGLSSFAPENSGRGDVVQTASLSVAYPQLENFFLRLSGTYNDRRSNLSYNNYRDVTAGAEMGIRFGGRGLTAR